MSNATSEQCFRALFDQIGDAVGLYDVVHRRILAANRGASEMLCYPTDEILKLGVGQISDNVPPYAEADAFRRLEAAFDGAEDLVEWRVRDASGRRFWVEVRLRRVTIDDVDLLLIVARDISERRAAAEQRRRGEELLAASEARFRDLFERAPLPYQSLDAAGVLLDVNQAWSRLFGFTRTEAIGRHMGEFLSESSRATLARKFPRLKAVGKVSGTVLEIRCRDGGSRQVEITGSTAHDADGNFLRTHCMLTDVTERNASLAALRDREERLRMFFSHAPIGMMTVTRELHLAEVNDMLSRLLGYSAEELATKHVADITHPDDRAADSKTIGRMFDGRISHCTAEKRYLHKDGHPIWVRVTRAAVRDDAGGIAYGIGLVEDISERREAERLRAAHIEQQRSVLVREVHHRIKNNLQGVVSLIEQLKRKQPEAALALEEAAGQISAIAVVHGLHSTTLSAEVRPRPLVGAIIESVARLSGVAIACPEAAATPAREWQLATGDTVSIALVLNELMHNAVKHTDATGNVEVDLDDRGECFKVRIRNRPARLPAQFDFAAGIGLGTGLTLLSGLLPREGTCLSICQRADGVEAELELREPCAARIPNRSQETDT